MTLKLVLSALVTVLIAAPALTQAPAGSAPGSREEAIVAAALDYSDGAYESDAGRLERALHPDLTKLIFMRRSPAAGLAARYSTFSDLLEPARTKGFFLDPDKRKTETAVLEIKDDVACVRVKTAMWCDYLQMIKVNGQWKIINVLWTLGLDTPPQGKVVPGFDAEKERPAAQAAALGYTEGQLSGDAAGLEKALHPETNQVTLMSMATAEAKVTFVMRSRYSGILEPVKAKLGLAPENARKAEVRILDMMDGMAFAAARTVRGTAYLQLQLLDGQWKVINVLVRPSDNTIPQARPSK
jgi:hypothetical protein